MFGMLKLQVWVCVTEVRGIFRSVMLACYVLGVNNLCIVRFTLLQALMAFIGDCPDVAMLEDVLIAVLDLLRHTPPGRIPLLAGMSGAQLFVSLLSREQPALRILGLHLLAHFVPYIQSGAPPGTPPMSLAFHYISGKVAYAVPGIDRPITLSSLRLSNAWVIDASE